MLGPGTWVEAQSFVRGLIHRSSRGRHGLRSHMVCRLAWLPMKGRAKWGSAELHLANCDFARGSAQKRQGPQGCQGGASQEGWAHEDICGRRRITIVATSFRSRRLSMLAD